MHKFLVELKRRRVVRAALVYLGAAFVVLQAAELLVEALQLPPVVFATVAIAALIGLPVAIVLAWAFDIAPTGGPPTRADASSETAWVSLKSAIAVVVLIAAGVLLGQAPGLLNTDAEPAAVSPVRRYEISLPEHAPVEFRGSSPLAIPNVPLAITPDGDRLVYVGSAPDSGTQLYVRDLGEFGVRPLPGSEGAYAPFISPDGQWVGFFAHDQLRVVPIDGGEARVLVKTPNPQGGAWWGPDRIIYNDRESNAHWWVPVTGGEPTRLYPGQRDDGTGVPVLTGAEYQPLPDGERFLIYDRSGRVAVYTPATGEVDTVMELPVNVRIASDTLAYSLGNELFALDFDARTATVSGKERRIGSQLRRDGGLAQFVVSDQTLIYAQGVPLGQGRLALGGDHGVDVLDLPAARYGGAAFSPDGRKIAITVTEAIPDIWILDLDRGERRRLTRGGANVAPHWSADGETIFFSSDRQSEGSTMAIYRKRPDSPPGEAERILEAPRDAIIMSLHEDVIAPVVQQNESVTDIYLANLRTGEMRPVANRPDVSEVLAEVSPDGRWLALTADASGRYEVFLQSLADESGSRVQITTTGGEEPRWSGDMSKIWYRYGRTLYAMPLSFENGRPVAGTPSAVFSDPLWLNILGYSYWQSPLDGRFLILLDSQPASLSSLRVIEGWRNVGADKAN
jgi:Tol biopolymer transport system component